MNRFTPSVRCLSTDALTLLAAAALTAAPCTSSAQDTTSTIRYKAVTITPVMSIVGDAFWRSRNVESDIGTPFQNIPFDHTTNARTSEFRTTGRHSKIGLLAETKSEDDSLTAFWEQDFL